MPNWVSNTLTIKGENANNVVNALLDENGDFDFNKVVPMPSLFLKTQASSIVDNIVNSLKEKYGDTYTKASRNDIVEICNTLYANYTDDIKSSTIENVINTLECIEKYGYPNWYYWSLDNWGTKWNASSTTTGDNVMYFDTAWSTPFPLIEKLSELYPNHTFEVKYADEDFGYNCGSYTLRNKKIVKSFQPKNVECAKRWVRKHFYC